MHVAVYVKSFPLVLKSFPIDQIECIGAPSKFLAAVSGEFRPIVVMSDLLIISFVVYDSSIAMISHPVSAGWLLPCC
jgi:hypothetical protein